MRHGLSVYIAVLMFATPAAASAQEAPPPPTTIPRGSTSAEVRDWNTIIVKDREVEPTAPRAAKTVAAKPTFAYWSLDWYNGDSFCIRRRSTTNPAIAQGAADARWYKAFAEANEGVRTECPTQPPEARTPPQVADDRAREFWDVRILPDPALKVVPDYAITGKLVYLQIAGPKDQRFDVDNPIGDDVVITASSRYLIDWGDGTQKTSTTSQGGPWPDGDVTHAYTHSAPGRTITVTQLWSATWSAGQNRGDLLDLQTTSTLILPVTQLQAVRNL